MKRCEWSQQLSIQKQNTFTTGDAAHGEQVTSSRAGKMAPQVPVHVGDLIEYAPVDADTPTPSFSGRVVEVDESAPHRCLIQVSPYDPFCPVNLADGCYKLIYSAGEVTKVTPTMIGWEVEFKGSDGQSVDHGVIKQVDCELNCALIAFNDGHKDWRDLSMNAFKVLGKPAVAASPPKASADTRLSSADRSVPVLTTTLALAIPAPDDAEFDWYTEGGHVELCGDHGAFIEGALLCSHGDGTLQLFNERHGFFEIRVAAQSVKVVIHGLASLKTVPLGKRLEVYSPMHGEFRVGTVLKSASLGRLTPIRFDDPVIGVEWVDLDHQTFKLLFLCDDVKEIREKEKDKASVPVIEPSPVQQHYKTRPVENPVSESLSPILTTKPQPPLQTSKNDQTHHHRRHPLVLPVLIAGQAVELMDQSTKQFTKYKVTSVRRDAMHRYDLEPSSNNSSFLLSTASVGSIATTINLAEAKARVQVTPDRWDEFRLLVVGYRVDVYQKTDRSVLTGKVVDVSADGEPPRVQVKFKDETKNWYDITTTKIKLRLPGAMATAPVKQRVEDTTSDESPGLWTRVDQPSTETRAEETTTSLTRQQSEKVNRLPPAALTRHVSSPGMLHKVMTTSHVPVLDFSSLKLIKDMDNAPSPVPPATIDSTVAEAASSDTRRSMSDLLPPMDDVWTEESVAGSQAKHYVRLSTGESTTNTPQWLRRQDEASGEWLILNTMTGVHFQLPGSSSGTPEPSSRHVVTLPVGPLEAARVVSQIPTPAIGQVDLCAQAFGS